MDEVHRPDIVRSGRRGPVLAELGLDPALGRLVAELQSQLIVNPVGLLDVDVPALTAQENMHARSLRASDQFYVGWRSSSISAISQSLTIAVGRDNGRLPGATRL